jgi:hypothetical protein
MLHIVKSLVIIIPDDHDHCPIIDLWSYTIIIIIQFYHNYYMNDDIHITNSNANDITGYYP